MHCSIFLTGCSWFLHLVDNNTDVLLWSDSSWYTLICLSPAVFLLFPSGHSLLQLLILSVFSISTSDLYLQHPKIIIGFCWRISASWCSDIMLRPNLSGLTLDTYSILLPFISCFIHSNVTVQTSSIPSENIINSFIWLFLILFRPLNSDFNASCSCSRHGSFFTSPEP